MVFPDSGTDWADAETERLAAAQDALDALEAKNDDAGSGWCEYCGADGYQVVCGRPDCAAKYEADRRRLDDLEHAWSDGKQEELIGLENEEVLVNAKILQLQEELAQAEAAREKIRTEWKALNAERREIEDLRNKLDG